MSLEELIEEYGGLILGILTAVAVITAAVFGIKPDGIIWNFMEKVLVSCAGGVR